MADYIITNGQLRSTDELMHWKYIKKKRVNGKWRYWYDEESFKRDMKDKLGYDERQRYYDAKKQYEKAKKTADEQQKVKTSEHKKAYDKWNTAHKDVSKELSKYANSPTSAYVRDVRYTTYKKKYDDAVKAKEELDKAADAAEKVGDNVLKAKAIVDKYEEEYAKTPLAKLNNWANSGADFVKKALSKRGVLDTYEEFLDRYIWTDSEEKAEKAKYSRKYDRGWLPTYDAESARSGIIEDQNAKKPSIPKKLSDLMHKAFDKTSEEDRALVNPDYDPKNLSTSENCAYCSAAYDLRRRGYDVTANAKAGDVNNTTSKILTWYDGAKLERMDAILKRQGVSKKDVLEVEDLGVRLSNMVIPKQWANTDETGYDIKRNLDSIAKMSDAVEKDMVSKGEGTRGIVLFNWTDGGGHACNYEVRDGKVVLVEAQTNRERNLDTYMLLASDVAYFRTDNAQPNEKVLEAVKNNKKKR